MKAIVLAAGMGTRLLPVTDHVPKPIIPFFGKPFLRYTLESLAGFVDEIAIVVHYRAEMIRDAIGQRVDGVPIQYVEQKRLCGTGDALVAARQFLQDRALVVLGDVYVTGTQIQGLLEDQEEAVLSLAEVSDPENHLGVSFEDNRVTALFSNSAWVDRGVWLLSPLVLEYLEPGGEPTSEVRLMHGVQAMVDADETVRVCCSTEPWVQIGDHTGVAGVIDAMRHIGASVGADEAVGSVDVTTVDCEISDSVIFGPGKLRNSRIERSLVYAQGATHGVEMMDEIRVVG